MSPLRANGGVWYILVVEHLSSPCEALCVCSVSSTNNQTDNNINKKKTPSTSTLVFCQFACLLLAFE